ncbi:unnamed protein product [Trichobilharzia szidati]|nr:unnamed protein product [Trichobilharzia szidati]
MQSSSNAQNTDSSSEPIITSCKTDDDKETGSLSPVWCAFLPGSGHCSSSVNTENVLTSNCQMTVHILRFGPGQDLKECLIHHVLKYHLSGAFIITCCGSVKTAHLRLANLQEKVFDGPFEITSLVGTLTHDGYPHLHISLADSHGNVFGGHLLGSIKIHTTVELVLGVTGIEKSSLLSSSHTEEQTDSCSSSTKVSNDHKPSGIRLIRKYSEETGFKELAAEETQQ